ncbi:Hypothetical protein ORPV_738 [Orpheovirus IHUMI-LCC2]|uniref:Uncharacterized protein n=1 Tax=Orpheovirus IHUMI-LCC2 TaxID=2023057 RepID=A0A2I2L516_9VIRU|nr:Hypothetical protein ORPV_738 [Orpheovirus IHUMI-LCC2]SNW62642.1 Hypothetical protein ORPV_738 [Orpheovirus IHUMI-LCC2]
MGDFNFTSFCPVGLVYYAVVNRFNGTSNGLIQRGYWGQAAQPRNTFANIRQVVNKYNSTGLEGGLVIIVQKPSNVIIDGEIEPAVIDTGDISLPPEVTIRPGDLLGNIDLISDREKYRWELSGNLFSNLLRLDNMLIRARGVSIGVCLVGTSSKIEAANISPTRGDNQKPSSILYIKVGRNAKAQIDGLELNRGAKLILEENSKFLMRDGNLEVHGSNNESSMDLICGNCDVTLYNTAVLYDGTGGILFSGNGKVNSKGSVYESNDVFTFHKMNSNRVYHESDSLRLPNGVVDDMVSPNKVHYTLTTINDNMTSLINPEEADYSFFKPNGNIISSGSVEDTGRCLVSDKERYLYTVKDCKNVAFRNIGRLHLVFSDNPTVKEVMITLSNVRRIKVTGAISNSARELLNKQNTVNLVFNDRRKRWENLLLDNQPQSQPQNQTLPQTQNINDESIVYI